MTPHRDKPRNSTVNVSQLVATFTDYDERSAPYDGRAMVTVSTGGLAHGVRRRA
jgi:hypothetical protein